MKWNEIEEVESMHEDEAKFKITLEPEQGIPVQQAESLDHHPGQKSERVTKRREPLQHSELWKILKAFPFPVKLHITKLFLTELEFLWKWYGSLGFAGARDPQDESNRVVKSISFVT